MGVAFLGEAHPGGVVASSKSIHLHIQARFHDKILYQVCHCLKCFSYPFHTYVSKFKSADDRNTLHVARVTSDTLRGAGALPRRP